MRSLRLAAAPIASALVLAAAGCEPLEDPSGKDKADVLERASAACAALESKLEKLIRPVDTGEAAVFYEEAAGFLDTTVDDIDGLDPPDPGRADWDEFVGGVRQQRDLLREAEDAAADGREGKLRTVEAELRRVGKRTQAAGERYGVKGKCVELPT